MKAEEIKTPMYPNIIYENGYARTFIEHNKQIITFRAPFHKEQDAIDDIHQMVDKFVKSQKTIN